jgi:pyruvate/2-oxoglutarate dehydrogenase complex dihydrolipoamide acyltransferase (E2) component
LAEEGDDISNLEIPKDEEVAKPAEPTKPLHSEKQSDAPPTSSPASPNTSKKHTSHIHVEGPVFPSVLRLLNEAGVEDYKKIKGTGVRGMLTKGDVLAFLGKASGPTGTYKMAPTTYGAPTATSAAPVKKEIKVSHGIRKSVQTKLKRFKPVDALTLRRLIASGMSDLSSTIATPKGKCNYTSHE